VYTGPDSASSEVALAYLPEERETDVDCRNLAATPRENLLDRATTWWVGLGLMLGALLVPLLVTEVPPLTDYPNHLARCYLLAFGGSDPALRQMFSAHWQIIPNIGVDLLLPQLMHIFPPLVAGRIMLALCLLVPTTGAIALSRAYFKRRSLWQIATGFAAFNVLFLMGFMNFELAIGIAMWGAAAWIRYREENPAAAVASAMILAPVVFFFHLFGFCFYAVLVGSYEFFVLLEKGLRTRAAIRYAAKRAAMFGLAMIMPVILYGASPLERVSFSPTWVSLPKKLYLAFDSVMEYSSLFDLLIAASLVAFLIFCVLNGRARISKAALICSTALLCVYLVTPVSFKGVYFVDTRLPIMLGFMVFAGFMPRGLNVRERTAAVAFFVILFVARVALITNVWVDSQRDLADLRQTIASVAAGSRVLAADVNYGDNPSWYVNMPASRRLPEVAATYWHLASFVLLDRHAFWPNIFAEESQQPISITQPYRELEAVRSPPLNYLDLTVSHVPQAELEHFPYLADWKEKFDYVLVLNAEGAPNLDHFLPNQLQLVDRQGIAALFRVRK
jgi:hypothetical protein